MLRPGVQQLACSIHNEDAVLHPRLAISCLLPKRAVASGVAFRRFHRERKFPALNDEYLVRAFGENSALRTPSPACVSEGLRPARDHLVMAGFLLPALFRLGK